MPFTVLAATLHLPPRTAVLNLVRIAEWGGVRHSSCPPGTPVRVPTSVFLDLLEFGELATDARLVPSSDLADLLERELSLGVPAPFPEQRRVVTEQERSSRGVHLRAPHRRCS